MKPRKKPCYFPQANNKPFAVHHNDYGIFSELRITNIGDEAVIISITVNDTFTPSVEVAPKVQFKPLQLPRKLRFGASVAVVLQGPSQYVKPQECLRSYPKSLLIHLEDGSAIHFGIWDMIRCKA